MLLAAKRCRVRPTDETVHLSRMFPKIVEADFLSHSSPTQGADVVVMNPPFGYKPAPTGCEWAQRKGHRCGDVYGKKRSEILAKVPG